MRAAFGAGWWMGFGYFLAGLWWVGAAFLVEADKFAWALPLGVVALPAALAFFPAAGFALARLLWSPGPARVFALAFGLGLAEWARGLLFTGFPWNDLGMALGSNLALAQIASVVGLHGLTFLTIAIFAAPATLWRVGESRLNLAPAGARRACARAHRRLRRVPARGAGQRHPAGRETAPDPAQRRPGRFVLAGKQGGDPAPLLRPVGARDLAGSIRGSRRHPSDLARVGVSRSFCRATRRRLPTSPAFLRGGATLITGAARREDGGSGPPRYFNSIEIVGRDGLSAERYDKQHLVPFGEYMPFASLLEQAHITQFVDIPGGFEAGSGRRVLAGSRLAGRHAAHLLRGDLSD